MGEEGSDVQATSRNLLVVVLTLAILTTGVHGLGMLQLEWSANLTEIAGGLYESVLGGLNYEDIDGDGKAREVLAHTKDTKWYEVGKRDGKPDMVGNVVSAKGMNFGGGVGDINGDGRIDIVRPDAWFEAPEDIRKGTWRSIRWRWVRPRRGSRTIRRRLRFMMWMAMG